jgi:hypothetical protein
MLGSECGYTPKEIGAMTLRDVRRIVDYRNRYPSLRVLVASIAVRLGIEVPTPGEKSKPLTPEEAKAYFRVVNSAGIGQI